jgi:hypothetical protein
LHQAVKFWLHAVYLGCRSWVLNSSFSCGLLRSSCSYQFANFTSSSPKTEYGFMNFRWSWILWRRTRRDENEKT